ncbi:low affinity immunoglobulin gamma Fc region receptor II-like [Acanthochromis polyacanthus]|uniref:Low affinity immunoglobulin gamma Fc region receptor II-like n=1 Tax=Acanthochromis polyacanthus TaxID=80966 RepID=A0A3Q1GQW1_9TELE|nr:low affinity immunoglobulin gamma Fc region receptor II-like [Acanthochromis polyacanthus]
MEFTSACLVISATLSILPDRSQFFRYESFSLSCSVPDNSSDWKVLRNTSSKNFVQCGDNWGQPNGFMCNNSNIYASDTGQYWCQSKKGECSNVLNVTVHTNVVILESPALPVMEGSKVTLRCSYKERYDQDSSSGFNASFYKNDVFQGNHTGEMVLPVVSKSHEGSYKCGHPVKGVSPSSWLTVRVKAKRTTTSATPTHPPGITPINLVSFILLFILYTVILILCVYVMRKLAQARAKYRVSRGLK